MTLLAEVVVDVPVWRLDRALTYEVPDRLAARAAVGSIVRAPLRGRRVRGWIVGLSEGDSAGVEPLAALSGRGPVFDDSLLEMARTMARRYVHPLAAFLRLMTPPRLGRPVGRRGSVPSMGPSMGPSRGPISSAGFSAELRRLYPAEDAAARYATLVADVLGREEAAILIVPEVREGSRVIDRLSLEFRSEVAVVHSGVDPAARAEGLWAAAEGARRVVLGGRAAVFAPAARLGAIIVHGEHDPSLKEQRSPYYDAREVALARGRAQGCRVVLASPTPSLKSLHQFESATSTSALVEPAREVERPGWPIVELVEVPRAPVPRRAIGAVIETFRRGGRTLVLLPRARDTRGGPGPERVARLLQRAVPEARVARADRPALDLQGALAGVLDADVLVATEAALAEVERPRVDCAIALGVDALLVRPRGRAAEDGFATLWALAGLVTGGSTRRRLLLETSMASHHAIQAIVRGHYGFFARAELQHRSDNRSPPFVTLIRIHGRRIPAVVVDSFRMLPDVELLGPAEGARGEELLLKVDNLEGVLDSVRDIVATSAEPISAEVDPRDW